MKRCGVAELEPECFPRGFGRYAGALRCGCHAIRRRETLFRRGLVLPPRMSCNQRYAIMARTTFGTSRPRRIDSRALRYFPQECMVRPPRKTHFRHRLSFFLSFLAVMLGNGPNRSYRRNPDGAGCRGGNERTAKPPERMHAIDGGPNRPAFDKRRGTRSGCGPGTDRVNGPMEACGCFPTGTEPLTWFLPRL